MTSQTTQQRAVIFHGYGATPTDHWFPWLAEQLQNVGIPTTIPAMPNPLAPDAQQWNEAARAALGKPDEHSIVVAHSLGCLAALRYLHSLADSWRVGTLVLVSGFLDRLPALPELDGFINDARDIAGLQAHVGRIVVIRSDDDSLVPPAHTDRLASLFGVTSLVVPGAGHFLASDGFTELPIAYGAITT